MSDLAETLLQHADSVAVSGNDELVACLIAASAELRLTDGMLESLQNKFEAVTAENEQLAKDAHDYAILKRARAKSGWRPGYGCCCEFDPETDEQTQWCKPHSEMRDENERLREHNKRLLAESAARRDIYYG